jgi:hypothetical protein
VDYSLTCAAAAQRAGAGNELQLRPLKVTIPKSDGLGVELFDAHAPLHFCRSFISPSAHLVSVSTIHLFVCSFVRFFRLFMCSKIRFRDDTVVAYSEASAQALARARARTNARARMHVHARAHPSKCRESQAPAPTHACRHVRTRAGARAHTRVRMQDVIRKRQVVGIEEDACGAWLDCWASRACYSLISHRAFTMIVTLVVGLNTVAFLAQYWDFGQFQRNWAVAYARLCSDALPFSRTSDPRRDAKRLYALREALFSSGNASGLCMELLRGKFGVDVVEGMPTGMPEGMQQALATSDYAFTVLFFVEMLITLVSIGPWRYGRDWSHLWSGAIALTSVAETFVGWRLPYLDTKPGFVRFLRALRLFRLLNLLESFPSLQKVNRSIRKSLGSLIPLFVIMVAFVVCFALIGIKIFGAFAITDGSRSNFMSFGPSGYGYGAFVTVFQILTLEDWPQVMYRYTPLSNASRVYFWTIICFGVYGCVNLFVAVSTHEFDRNNCAPDMTPEDEEVMRCIRKRTNTCTHVHSRTDGHTHARTHALAHAG